MCICRVSKRVLSTLRGQGSQGASSLSSKCSRHYYPEVSTEYTRGKFPGLGPRASHKCGSYTGSSNRSEKRKWQRPRLLLVGWWRCGLGTPPRSLFRPCTATALNVISPSLYSSAHPRETKGIRHWKEGKERFFQLKQKVDKFEQ